MSSIIRLDDFSPLQTWHNNQSSHTVPQTRLQKEACELHMSDESTCGSTPPSSPSEHSLDLRYFDTLDWFERHQPIVESSDIVLAETAVAVASSPQSVMCEYSGSPRRMWREPVIQRTVSFFSELDEGQLAVKNTFLNYADEAMAEGIRHSRRLKTAPPKSLEGCGQDLNIDDELTADISSEGIQVDVGNKTQEVQERDVKQYAGEVSSVSPLHQQMQDLSKSSLATAPPSLFGSHSRDFLIVVKNTFLNVDSTPCVRETRRLKTAPSLSFDQFSQELPTEDEEEVDPEEQCNFESQTLQQDSNEGCLAWPDTPTPSSRALNGVNSFMMPPCPAQSQVPQPQIPVPPRMVHSTPSPVRWSLNARKLLFTDTRNVSLPCKVGFGEGLDVPLKLVLYPKNRDAGKHTRGSGHIQLRCEETPCMPACKVSFRISIGCGKKVQSLGPFQHDFSQSVICDLSGEKQDWNFAQLVDLKSMTLDVCLEVMTCSAASAV